MYNLSIAPVYHSIIIIVQYYFNWQGQAIFSSCFPDVNPEQMCTALLPQQTRRSCAGPPDVLEVSPGVILLASEEEKDVR